MKHSTMHRHDALPSPPMTQEAVADTPQYNCTEGGRLHQLKPIRFVLCVCMCVCVCVCVCVPLFVLRFQRFCFSRNKVCVCVCV